MHVKFKSRLCVQQLNTCLLHINIGSASSIVRFIVGGMDILLNGLLLAHEVLASAEGDGL